jgi:hypothetical protein
MQIVVILGELMTVDVSYGVAITGGPIPAGRSGYQPWTGLDRPLR